ncbi:protein of unknown function [Kyrpidia spormannii]|uniref:Uncharacterized protein n=1 Tax=Kyrpidia spormannii TaxID=2055160 RepID=A0A6F9EHZ6_9BACL|nr:protein of unknown function [Kyrpidia spormannii]
MEGRPSPPRRRWRLLPPNRPRLLNPCRSPRLRPRSPGIRVIRGQPRRPITSRLQITVGRRGSAAMKKITDRDNPGLRVALKREAVGRAEVAAREGTARQVLERRTRVGQLTQGQGQRAEPGQPLLPRLLRTSRRCTERDNGSRFCSTHYSQRRFAASPPRMAAFFLRAW